MRNISDTRSGSRIVDRSSTPIVIGGSRPSPSCGIGSLRANSSRAQGGSDSRIRVSLERRVLSFTLRFFLSCIREYFLLRQLRVLDIQDDGVGVTVSYPAVRLEPREQLAVFRQTLRFG